MQEHSQKSVKDPNINFFVWKIRKSRSYQESKKNYIKVTHQRFFYLILCALVGRAHPKICRRFCQQIKLCQLIPRGTSQGGRIFCNLTNSTWGNTLIKKEKVLANTEKLTISLKLDLGYIVWQSMLHNFSNIKILNVFCWLLSQ